MHIVQSPHFYVCTQLLFGKMAIMILQFPYTKYVSKKVTSRCDEHGA